MSSKIVEALMLGAHYAALALERMADQKDDGVSTTTRQDLDLIISALAEARAAQTGEWAMKPREPTPEMREAAASFGGAGGYSSQRGDEAVEAWRHMYDAAPPPVSVGAEPVVWSEADIANMRVAFSERFNEPTPRTETLMGVAAVGYRKALGLDPAFNLSAPPPVSVGAEPVAWQARQLSEAGWGHWFEVDERSLKQYAKKERWEVRALGVIAPPPVEASQQQADAGSEPASGEMPSVAERWWAKRYTEARKQINRLTAELSDVSGRSAEMATKAADEIERLTAELDAAKSEASRLRHALECIAVDLQQHFDGIGMEYSSSYHHSVVLPKAIRATLAGHGHYLIDHELDDEGRASLARFMGDEPRDRDDRIVQMMRQYRSEAEALRKDAERYRWMRDGPDGQVYEVVQCFAEEWDAAIDAAIASQQRSENRDGGEG